ncbi:sugar phosphate isomerase/epimerase [Streptacidiphilus sp. MAP12-33]|uniref:metabolite traffic protein EboE n=1 Tax=Streptacidiphilus sp. MAP12-33 TaxID=3156266 RepID=UPI0035178061
MRFLHPDGTTVHLAYCTNVHPAETLDGIVEQLAQFAGPARHRLGVPRLGVGLWLAADLAARLVAEPQAVARLRGELDGLGLEVFTLNGFPYRGFHAPVVKRAVYVPDWAQPARLEYTLNLARVLVALMPQDVTRGSVSTLPLAWRTAWTRAQRVAAARHLDELVVGLKVIEAETGRKVRVAMEPEPGCVAETVEQAVAALTGVDRDWVGVCLDACHLAVTHEDPAQAVAHLAEAAVAVVKLQASAALEASRPGAPEVQEALRPFAEPRFLHQTREAAADGVVLGADDLGPALAGGLPARAPWRIHYHVPLYQRPDAPLDSTVDTLRETLRLLFGGPRALTDHIEVETYTWSVLPERSRPADGAGLVEGLAAELDWARRELLALGLREQG